MSVMIADNKGRQHIYTALLRGISGVHLGKSPKGGAKHVEDIWGGGGGVNSEQYSF